MGGMCIMKVNDIFIIREMNVRFFIDLKSKLPQLHC